MTMPVRHSVVLRFLLSLLVFSCVVASLLSKANAAKPTARREDVPLIKCPTCEHVASNLLRQVNALRKSAAPKKISEMQILGVVEKLCNVLKDEGDWIQWIDILETENTLELKKQRYKGECGEECKTIQKACNEVMGFADTDVAEILYMKPEVTLEDLSKEICVDLTGACKHIGEKPKVPKGRKPGPAFVKKSEKELERESMLRNIEGKQDMFAEKHPDAPRMPKMKLYSRDDLMKKTMFTGKEGEEDEEDEDEEEEEEQGAPDSGGSSGQDDELRAIAEAMKSAQTHKQKEDAASSKKPSPISWWERARQQVNEGLESATRSATAAFNKVSQQISQGLSSIQKPAEPKKEL